MLREFNILNRIFWNNAAAIYLIFVCYFMAHERYLMADSIQTTHNEVIKIKN